MTAVLLLVLSFSPEAFSQCSWTARESAQFRATVLDVATEGSFVWAANSYGVQLLHGTAPLDTIPLAGTTRVVVPDGRGAAYAGSGTRVYALRRSGNTIEKTGAIELGAAVNDLALADGNLFAATANGIVHIASDTTGLTRLNTILETSSLNVASLAILGSNLYAADGDATVEMFSLTIPSLPQRTGQIETMPRATAVHAGDGLLFVSDRFGQTTDVFSGATRVGTLSLGATSFAAASPVQFVAGPDRTLRAIDIANTSRIAEIFEHQLPPTDGSDNAIHALARSGNTLYVAAGDIGLVTFDVTALARPHPLSSTLTGATTSVIASATGGYFTDASGFINEVTIDATGVSLTAKRTWNDVATGSAIRDLRGDLLLTSAGSTLTRWNLTAQPPTPTTATLAGPVQGAVLTRSGFLALLANGSIVSETGNVTLPYAVASLARSGDAVVLVEIRPEAKQTVLHYFANGLAAETRSAAVNGIAIGGAALDATRAAVFTFEGVYVIDLATGNTRVIAGSNRAIPKQLAFSGDDLLVLDTRTLYVYDDARTLTHRHALPANATAITGAAPYALVATAEGMLVAQYERDLPEAVTPFTSRFYRKIAVAGGTLAAFSDAGVDVYSTLRDMPHFVGAIRAAGAVDVAASADHIFTLAANGTVTAYSPAGVALAQVTLQEGADAQPLGIAAAGNAVWVAISTGCQSGQCVKKTLVLDPLSLATTATLTGGFLDVTSSGTRAFALFDAPDEVRVLDITDPLHPTQIASVAAPTAATSIAAISGKVFVAGDKVYVYSETTLAPSTPQLSAVTPAATQQIRIDGGCAVISGRGANPEAWTVPAFNAGGALFETPSNVRSIATDAGRVYFLTDHSLEVWSARPAQPASKRRSTR